jgi:hypothetical protein
MKIDLKFIQFYIKSTYGKSLEEYYFVQKSTVSGWRVRGLPKKYIKIFIESEGSDNIYNLFEKIYPK